jgi:hypothetical protein
MPLLPLSLIHDYTTEKQLHILTEIMYYNATRALVLICEKAKYIVMLPP